MTDKAATLTAVFETHFSNVVARGCRSHRSRTSAEDAAQHAFAALIDRWESVQHPPAFVHTVASNYLRDAARHQAVAARHLTLVNDTEDDDSERIDLADIVGRLSPRRQTIVRLRFYDDLSLTEISHALGIPIGSVKSGLSRALQQLRTELVPLS